MYQAMNVGVMYMCVSLRGINFASVLFFDWIFELLPQCGIFKFFILLIHIRITLISIQTFSFNFPPHIFYKCGSELVIKCIIFVNHDGENDGAANLVLLKLCKLQSLKFRLKRSFLFVHFCILGRKTHYMIKTVLRNCYSL